MRGASRDAPPGLSRQVERLRPPPRGVLARPLGVELPPLIGVVLTLVFGFAAPRGGVLRPLPVVVVARRVAGLAEARDVVALPLALTVADLVRPAAPVVARFDPAPARDAAGLATAGRFVPAT